MKKKIMINNYNKKFFWIIDKNKIKKRKRKRKIKIMKKKNYEKKIFKKNFIEKFP